MQIAIVFGGKSVEHDVSIVTAQQIYNIAKATHKISLIYISKTGDYYLYNNQEFILKDFKTLNKSFKPITLYNKHIYKQGKLGFKKMTKIDCAIMCLHGGDGENGIVSSRFINAQIPVTAGNPTALGISMNKWLSKMFFNANKIKCVKGIYATPTESVDKLDKQITKSFGYPVIVKANSGGSSIGIKAATNKTELKQALVVAFEFDDGAVIEQQLQNFTEYNCAVLGDSLSQTVSQIDEPVRKENLLTFADKYLAAGNKKEKGSMKFQARKYPKLKPELQNKIQTISKQIFSKLGFYGVVRIDYIYTPSDNKLYINEINAIPGSLANYYFANNKLQQGVFLDKLINIGIDNYNKISNINKNYITKLF